MHMKLTFAVDIDGTITENGTGRIHLDALSSLRVAADAGHNVIFVTRKIVHRGVHPWSICRNNKILHRGKRRMHNLGKL